jgi:hypothetical protein
MKTGFGRISVLILATAILAGGRLASSYTSQNSVGGGAFGAGGGTTATVSGSPITASQPAVAPVSLPPQGGSFTNQAASSSASIPGVMPASSTGLVTDTTSGSLTQSGAHAESSSTVNGMSILGGLVTGSQIVARAASDGNGTTATSTSAGSFASSLMISGALMDQQDFPPNTRIPVSGFVNATVAGSTQAVPVTGTVTINEQIIGGDGVTTSYLTVNYVHVSVSSSGSGPVTFTHDEVVASAFSSVTFTAGSPPPNSPPSLNLPGPQTVRVGNTLTFGVSATDPDASDTLSLTATDIPSGATFTPNPATGNPANGQLSFTPVQSQAGQIFTVTFTAKDSHGATASGAVAITVVSADQNHPPILSVPGPQIIGVGQTLRFIVTATDPDGDSVTLSASSVPAGGSFNPATGDFAFTPTGDQVGQVFAVDFTATDSRNASTSAPVQITVVSSTTPGPPVISGPPSPIKVSVDDNLTFTVSAVSPSGCPTTISASNLPDNATFDPATNKFSFTPAASQKGKVFTVNFTATDCKGQTATATVTILVVNPDATGPGHICIPVSQMSFGPTPVGGCCGAVTITLSNLGGGPLTINSISLLNGRDFSVDGASALPAVIPSGGTIQLRVAFQPKGAAPVRDTLTIATSDPDQPTVSVDLKGKGTKQ